MESSGIFLEAGNLKTVEGYTTNLRRLDEDFTVDIHTVSSCQIISRVVVIKISNVATVNFNQESALFLHGFRDTLSQTHQHQRPLAGDETT